MASSAKTLAVCITTQIASARVLRELLLDASFTVSLAAESKISNRNSLTNAHARYRFVLRTLEGL